MKNRKCNPPLIRTLFSMALVASLLAMPFMHSSGEQNDTIAPQTQKERNSSTSTPSGWSGDVRLSVSAATNDLAAIAVNEASMHIVWQNMTAPFEIFYKRSLNNGVTWEEQKIISDSPGEIPSSSAIALNGSTIHVVWHQTTPIKQEVFYAKSLDNGDTWTAPIQISEGNNSNSKWPSIAVEGDNVYVVFGDDRISNQYEIYFKNSSDAGQTWSIDKRLTNYPAGTDDDPKIAVNGSNLHLKFSRNLGDVETFYMNSPDGGQTWSAPVMVSTAGWDSEVGAIAVNGSNIHITWQDYKNSNAEIYYRNSTDGGSSFNPEVRLTNDPNFSGTPSVAVENNNVSVLYVDDRNKVGTGSDLYILNSTNGGGSWGSETRLTFSPNDKYSVGPTLYINNNITHVVWEDNRNGAIWENEVYYKRYPDFPADTTPPTITHTPITGTPIGQPINITAEVSDNVALSGVWLNYTGVNGTNYNVSMAGWNQKKVMVSGLGATLYAQDGNYSFEIPGQDTIGIVSYFIWANDTSGAYNQTANYQIQIYDVTNPEINHAPVPSAGINTPINITANVTDDVGVDAVYLNYTDVYDVNQNVSMTQWNGNWSYEIPGQDNIGYVDYFIWANDTSDNDNMTVAYPIQILDNVNPVADAGMDQSVNEDVVVYFDGSNSFDNIGIEWYNWSLGDGSYSNGIGNIKPSHIYANAGMYIITLNVSDAAGNWDTDISLVFVNNAEPIADAGSDKIVNEGISVLFNGSASNDTTSDVLNLTYLWYFGDGESDVGINVTHIYDDDGVYNTTLIVTDDNGFVDSDTITVTVNNVAPTIEPILNQTILEDSLFTFKINATDVPADTLTFSDNTTLFDIDQTTGMIEFTPTNDDVGNYSVNITVVDDDGGFNYTVLNITVVNTNDAPVIETISQQSTIEDVEFTLQVDASDVDVDDVLTYSLTSYPSGMNIDGTGLITWTPTNDDVVEHTVTVKVEDIIGAFDTDTFTIIVSNVNDAPTIISTSLANATEDRFYMASLVIG